MKNEKSIFDFKTDAVLSYGVAIGRFVFEESNTIVYGITRLSRVGQMDNEVISQLSVRNYQHLLQMSSQIDCCIPGIASEVTDPCYMKVLCDECGIFGKKSFTLADVDQEETELCNQ